MKQKYFNTLVALALLGALAGAITYWEKRKGRETSQNGKTETTSREKLYSLDASRVQSLTFRPRDGPPVACRRQGESWTIVEPRKLPADQSSISSLLDNLTTATLEQVVEEKPANLKDFGLEHPAVALEVTADAKPEKFIFLLGDETPTGGGVYAQVAGNPRVVILASTLKSSFEKSLFDLRDKRAVTLDVDQLQRVEVESKGKRYALVKNPEGFWNLMLPPAVRADRFTVGNLVDRLRGLSMQSIVAENKNALGKYGFSVPAARVQLSGPGGGQTLILGRKDDPKEGDRYFAMNSALEPVFTLGADFLTQFQKDPADLRDKDLFSFSSFEAKRVEVETPKGQRVFEKQKDNWKQTAPGAKNLETDKVEGFLNRLRDLRADSFPRGGGLASFGLAKPGYRFKVQSGEKNLVETVEASKVGEHVYARRITDPVASELAKTALDDIEKALNDL